LKKGLLDTRLVKKAFLNIKIPEFGRCLYKGEVDSLVASIDCNDDGVVSAHEFKHWLFPAHKKEDQESLAQYLRKIIMNSFDGDVWAMYREFCNGSEQMYKADFVIVLKTLDSAISRHEALAMANKIAGTDKMITMAHLQAALGVSAGRTILGGEGSVSNSESVDMDGYSLSQSQSQSQTFQSPRTKRRQRREQGSGSKLATHEEGAGGVSPLDEEGVSSTPRTPKRGKTPRGSSGGTPGGDLGTEQDAAEGKFHVSHLCFQIFLPTKLVFCTYLMQARQRRATWTRTIFLRSTSLMPPTSAWRAPMSRKRPAPRELPPDWA
jgi:Ca2+-binding EF-hand superfamily protein